MEITSTKKRIIWSSIFGIASLIIVVLNYKLYMIKGKFNIPLFSLSLFLPVLFSFLFATTIKFKDKVNKYITVFILLFSAFLSYVIIELLGKNNMFGIEFKRMLFNFIIIAFLYLLVYIITNRIRLTIILSNVIIFALGFVNYAIICFRGTPFVPWDILSIKTAASVAGAYKFIPSFYLILAVLLFVFVISLSLKVNYKFKLSKVNVAIRFTFLIIIILFTSSFYKTNIINFFELETNLWQPVKEYSKNGFLASFVKQSKNLFTAKPTNYSIQNVNKILDKYFPTDLEDPEILPEPEDVTDFPEEEVLNTPHVIVIMNESFSDLKVNGDFKISEDYMPYYRSLTENAIKGYTYVSVLGGQTPNSEWEFLTNNSMAFLPYRTVPYQQYIHSKSPSLANTLRDQGYSANAVHPWYGSGYRRNAVYPLIGFETFDSLETLNDLEYIRKYPSDISTYDYIIKMFEERDIGKKFFNFTVTMQNHSGYDLEGYDSTIFLTEIPDCPKTEQYLSIVKESDEALKYLIDYFSAVEEPVIILFFGDHQPPYLEEDFWNSVLDPEQSFNISRYLTPFTLWANYDIEEQYIEYTSLNYLSLLLCDTAGLKTTKYMEFLRIIQEQIPVITGNGYMDSEGNYYSFEEHSEYLELIQDYQLIQYNNIFDGKNRIKDLFTIIK